MQRHLRRSFQRTFACLAARQEGRLEDRHGQARRELGPQVLGPGRLEGTPKAVPVAYEQHPEMRGENAAARPPGDETAAHVPFLAHHVDAPEEQVMTSTGGNAGARRCAEIVGLRRQQ